MSNFVSKLLMWTWELPQSFIGGLLRAIALATNVNLGNFAIGRFIFLQRNASTETLYHEIGHGEQSIRLGWFWIPVIGIPSVVHYWWFKLCGAKRGADYYSFYTEKWADKLGGVKRD